MSVLIKGMEMPKSCNACMFDVYGLCLINKNLEGKDELTHSCPLFEIPPHGRLIDVDAPMRLEIKIDGGMNMCVTDIYAPTVIPAENLAKTIGKSQDSHEIEGGE